MSESVAIGEPAERLLNLGCGDDYKAGWWNVDISPKVESDQQFDIRETPWPLAADHFELLRAEHVLEHCADPVPVMRECARVVEPGGHIEIVVPTGINARTDPTHADEWTYQTPEYFDVDGPYGWEADCPLVLVNRTLSLHCHGPMRVATPLVQAWARRHPQSAIDIPATSGELTAVFKVIE